MTTASLESRIEESFAAGADAVGDTRALEAFLELRTALEAGTLRAAEPDDSALTGWRVNAWVKRGILLGFRIGKLTDMAAVAHSRSWINRPIRRAASPRRMVCASFPEEARYARARMWRGAW